MNTDNNTPADTKELEKSKGPIRFEAIVPIAIVCAATYFYFALLFDLHLRKGIEWTASYVHGAEVNVAKLHTSFLRGTFRMTGLQVTDKEEPTRNLIVIGDIRFGFLWDALLRAKFVVEDAPTCFHCDFCHANNVYAPKQLKD